MESIKEYIEENQQVINKYLSRVILNPKKKQVHKIRVGIKKINSICQFMQFLVPENSVCGKCRKRTHKIFKALGKLRELEHNKDYFKNYHLPDASEKVYAKFYEAEKRKLSRKYRKALYSFNPGSYKKDIKRAEKLGKDITDDKISAQTKQFVSAKMDKVDRLLTLKKFKKPQNIHEVRRQLKLLKYTLDSLHDFDSLYSKTFASKLKRMEAILGDWHDKFVLIQFTVKLIEKNKDLEPFIMIPFHEVSKKLSVENRDEVIFKNLKQIRRIL